MKKSMVRIWGLLLGLSLALGAIFPAWAEGGGEIGLGLSGSLGLSCDNLDDLQRLLWEHPGESIALNSNLIVEGRKTLYAREPAEILLGDHTVYIKGELRQTGAPLRFAGGAGPLFVLEEWAGGPGTLSSEEWASVTATGEHAAALEVRGNALVERLEISASGAGGVGLVGTGNVTARLSRISAGAASAVHQGALVSDASRLEPAASWAEEIRRVAVWPDNLQWYGFWVPVNGSLDLPELAEFALYDPGELTEQAALAVTMKVGWSDAGIDLTRQGSYAVVGTPQLPHWWLPIDGAGSQEFPVHVVDPATPHLTGAVRKGEGAVRIGVLYNGLTAGAWSQNAYFLGSADGGSRWFPVERNDTGNGFFYTANGREAVIHGLAEGTTYRFVLVVDGMSSNQLGYYTGVRLPGSGGGEEKPPPGGGSSHSGSSKGSSRRDVVTYRQQLSDSGEAPVREATPPGSYAVPSTDSGETAPGRQVEAIPETDAEELNVPYPAGTLVYEAEEMATLAAEHPEAISFRVGAARVVLPTDPLMDRLDGGAFGLLLLLEEDAFALGFYRDGEAFEDLGGAEFHVIIPAEEYAVEVTCDNENGAVIPAQIVDGDADFTLTQTGSYTYWVIVDAVEVFVPPVREEEPQETQRSGLSGEAVKWIAFLGGVLVLGIIVAAVAVHLWRSETRRESGSAARQRG